MPVTAGDTLKEILRPLTSCLMAVGIVLACSSGLIPWLIIRFGENFSSFVFSQKYGLIAVVARTSPLPGPRLSPVKIRTKLSLTISPY
jgi:hypothetical protein